MTITVDGIHGALSAPLAAAPQLALDLMCAGYSVRINGLRVRTYYGPGYDYAEWAEGDFEGTQVGSQPPVA